MPWQQHHGRLRLVAASVATMLILTLAGCTSAEGGGSSYGDAVTGPGLGDFTFEAAGDLSDRPVRVWYFAPQEGVSRADVVIVMPGAERNGDAYRADWAPLVGERRILLLVPEFDEDEYPGSSAYNLGNMLNEDGTPQPEEQWSFHVIEEMFDYVVADVHSQAKDYALFGHSAGAQFVHRFIEFQPDHRARVAVAANAGWYTTPEDSVGFPYGLASSAVRESDMGPAFASNLIILLGADDIDSENESLRKDAESDAQGTNRLERGFHFFLTSRRIAAEHSLPFSWRLTVVPGIDHSHTDMATAAAPLVISGSPRIAELSGGGAWLGAIAHR